VASLARRGAYVAAAELDPGVRVLVGRRLRQADDQLGLVALLAQEPVEDDRVHEAARPVGAEAEASVDGVREARGRVRSSAAPGLAQPRDEGGELLAAEADEDARVERPDRAGAGA
jgi:hypothetical protein